MNNDNQILGTESIGKLLIKYSLPAMIGMMVNGLYNVVDRIFIGNIPGVGPMAITGVGITMPIMTIMLAFAMLIGVGTTTNISIKLGQGKREEAERLIGNSLSLAVIIGLTLTAIGLLFGKNILELFGASENTLYYAKSYINIILVGCTFNIIAFSLNSMIRADGNPKLSATIMVVGCLANIMLDALFIFGFNMGIQGAALATVISQFITAIWGVSYYVRGKSNLKFSKSNLKLDKTLIKTIFSIGCAPFAMQVAASLVQVIANNALITYGGDLAVGAMATISSVNIMILMPIGGLTQGAQPIIGFNYGAKKYDRAEKTLKICIYTSLIALSVAWIGVQLFPTAIVGIFNRDAQLMAISVDGIRKYLGMMPLISISYIGSNYIQSIGKPKQAMFLSLLRQVILLVPMMLILPRLFGLDGVWFAQPIADIIAASVTFIMLKREFKLCKGEDMECVSSAS